MPDILILGEAYGANEAKVGAPFVGSSGVELLRQLDEVGIIALTAEDRSLISRFYNESLPSHIDMIWRMHPEITRTNVFNQHPPGNKLEFFCSGKADAIPGYPTLLTSKYVRKEFAYELDRLADEIIAANPNLILALGNTALWAICGTTGISKLRGATRLTTHLVEDFKVLPTYHPAAVLRQWELRPMVIMDLTKAKREAAFPELRRPARSIWIEPNLADLEIFYERYLTAASQIAIDIETAGDQITCIGFAPSRDIALVIPIHDPRKSRRSYWPSREHEAAAWRFIRRVLEDRRTTKVFQNGLYDIAFLWRAYGIQTYNATHDTMLLHHALQPEALKGLGFLGSIYTDEGAWKSDRKGNATLKRDD